MHRLRRWHPASVPMRRRAAALDHATAAQLRHEQDRRLRRLVRWAATRSPYYRRWFAEASVDWHAIRTVDDLPLLPLLERRDLVEHTNQFLALPRRLTWPAQSSGTSGSVVTVHRTAGSSVYELAVLQRQWSWFGVPRNARRAILRGSDFYAEHSTIVKPIPGGRQLLISSFQLAPENTAAILAALRKFRPHVIEGWPSSITLLAGLLRDLGETLPVQAIITSSEVMGQAQQELMREVFQGPIVDHYGQTERVTMAGTCEYSNYHIFPDYGIVELLPVDDNSWEIVGTPLHNWGFPLFRYRTGDTVGPAPEGPCPCGRAFPLLGRIDGRKEDAFTAADGRPIPLPGTIIDCLPGLREAQAVQRAPGHFEIRMVPGEQFDRAATTNLARRNIERLIGPGQSVTFAEMTRIPRASSGKLKTTLVLNDLAQ
jgi:phenylacetate-CoA ligase